MLDLKYVPKPLHPDPTQWTLFAIAEVLYPFRPKSIFIDVEETGVDRIVAIKIGLMPDRIFTVRMNEIWDLTTDPMELAEIVGFKAGQYFASFRAPVPNNISLGEN